MQRTDRRVLMLGAVCALLAGVDGRTLAHGFGQRYTLPIPLWLYLYGAAAAVVLSFLLVGYFIDGERATDGYRRVNLLAFPWFRSTLAARPFLALVRALSVALLALTVAAGILGDQATSLNFAPTFIWVIWWVGLGFFTAFVGNIWPLVNPWAVTWMWADRLSRRLGARDGLALNAPYPERLGVWPALALYVCFVWVELVYEFSARPRDIALFALVYGVITWTGMTYFGPSVWLRHGEAFGVFFGILARFAPTEVRAPGAPGCGHDGAETSRRDVSTAAGRIEGEPPAPAHTVNCYACFEHARPEERELNVRPLAAGLLGGEPVGADRLAFVVFMLASVTVDGLFTTPLWTSIEETMLPRLAAFGTAAYAALQTAALVGLPMLFLLVYYLFAAAMRALGRAPGRVAEVAAVFVYSLVPIALAYHVAHYYSLLLVQGQSIVPLLSDPFGWGWDLFGTVGYRINVALLSAGFLWYSQVALIVLGHVVAVYLAHVIALRLLGDPRRALRSQYPMLALMVLYTVSSLWIIAQPATVSAEAGRAEPRPIVRLSGFGGGRP